MSGEDFSRAVVDGLKKELREAKTLLLKQNEQLKLAQTLYFAVASFLAPFDSTVDEYTLREAVAKACFAYAGKKS
jgi:hypothetical protein